MALTPMPNPYFGLRGWLLTFQEIADLTGGRVYTDDFPRAKVGDNPQAAVVIAASGGSGDGSNLERLHIHGVRVDFRSYGRDIDQAWSVERLVARACDDFDGAVAAGVSILSLEESGGPNVDFDDRFETDWPFVLSSYIVKYDDRARS